MSVMSVEPPARGAPGGIAAERVHRPGSRRLGGVEATGASPGVAASRPHRSDPRAGPVRRTPCARGAWGEERAGGLGLRLACPRELRTGAGTTDLNEVVRPRVSAGFPRDATGKKGYQIHSSAMLLEQVDRTAPKIGKILRAGHQRFSTAFRSRVPFVRGSRGVRRDEAPTISSTRLGDRAEH